VSMRRLVAPLVLGAVVFVSGGCAFIGPLVQTVSPPASPDVGDWSSVPMAVDPALVAEAVLLCLGPRDGSLSDSLALVDQRTADMAAFIWVKGQHEAACLLVRDAAGARAEDTWSSQASGPAPSRLRLTDTDCGPPTVVSGTVAPGTTALVITTAAGRHIDASVGHGRFLAWWPGRDDPVRLAPSAAGGRLRGERLGASMCTKGAPPVP